MSFRRSPEPLAVVKILCTADVHIGRRPSRLPERVDAARLSCARAWETLVERAIEEQVDLLLVAGDLVDEKNRYYEAAGPVEAGVNTLTEAGIPLLAVAGNHDHESLSWLAARFNDDQFRLLGHDGRWERHTVMSDGRAILHVDGWSFPAPAVLEDPLDSYPLQESDDVPVLAMVHGDLDQPGSRYAPLSSARLSALPVNFWLLGHVHAARLQRRGDAPWALYPGSPQAMDPGEPGVHGPWLLEIDPGGRFSARPLPLSGVRYETIDVDVDGVEDEGEVHQRVNAAVYSALADVEAEAGPLEYLSLRLRLTGRTKLHRTLEGFNWSAATEEMAIRPGQIEALVERVVVATRPARDLEALAKGRHAPALLARLVRGLELGTLTPAEEALLHRAMTRVEEVSRLPAHRTLHNGEVATRHSPEQVGEILREQALLLLDTLLAEGEAV